MAWNPPKHAFSPSQPASDKSPNPAKREKRRLRCWGEVLAVIGIIALCVSLMLPMLSQPRCGSPGLKCRSESRQIAMAARQYAIEHPAGLAPASLTELLEASDLDATWLYCPFADYPHDDDVDSIATVPFAYVGQGVELDPRRALTPDEHVEREQTVLVYEVPGEHWEWARDRGANLQVEYADGESRLEPLAVVAAIHIAAALRTDSEPIVVDEAFRREAELAYGAE